MAISPFGDFVIVWESYGQDVVLKADLPTHAQVLMTDPQTSGGLLACVAPAAAERLKPEAVLCLGDWPTSKVLRFRSSEDKIPLYAHEATAQAMENIFHYIFDANYKYGGIARVSMRWQPHCTRTRGAPLASRLVRRPALISRRRAAGSARPPSGG